MNSFNRQAKLYAENHQQPLTRYSHYVGIPLLYFSVMILLGFFHIVIPAVLDITVALIGTLVLIGYYFYLNWRLAIPLSILLLFMLWVAHMVSYDGPTSAASWAFILTFVISLGCLFAGHYVEDRKPSLIDNVWQALIAPMFFMAELFFLAGYMEDLRGKIEPVEVVKKPRKDKAH